MELRLLHTADVHLDWLYEKYLPEMREKRRAEVRGRLNHLVDLAIKHQVAAVLIAGDFFHGEGIAESTLNFCLHQLEELSKRGIWTLIVTGNHDPRDAGYWQRRRFPERVKIFSGDAWEVFSELPGVEILGLSFLAARRDQRVLTTLPARTGDGVRVCLVHSQILEGKTTADYYPIAESDVLKSDLDYIALGHVHRPRAWYWGRTRLVYPGSPSRLTFKDVEPRGVHLLHIADGQVYDERIELTDREFRTMELDLTRLGNNGVYQTIQEVASKELCLRVRVNGVGEDGAEFLGDGIIRDFTGSFYHLEVEDQTVFPPRPGEEEVTVKGSFLKKMAERLADPALTDQDRQVLKYALYYGLTALKGVTRK